MNFDLNMAAYTSLGLALLLAVWGVDRKKTFAQGADINLPLSLYFPGFLALALFYLGGRIDALAGALLLLMILLTVAPKYALSERQRFAAALVLVVLALVAAVHRIPGVENLVLYRSIHISPGSGSFSIFANLDKGFAGLALLMMLYFWPKPVAERPLLGWSLVPVGALLVAVVGLFAGLKLYYKLSEITLAFVTVNLLFTCIAEEAFFRGLLQTRLVAWFSARSPYGVFLGIACTGLLFGAVHLGAGLVFALLAAVAGIVYGLVYQLTGKISAAVLVHWLVNTIHFVFLTYPA